MNGIKKRTIVFLLQYVFANCLLMANEIIISEPPIVKFFSSFSESDKYEFKIGGFVHTGTHNSSLGISSNIYNNMNGVVAPLLGIDIRYHLFHFDNKLSKIKHNFNVDDLKLNINANNMMDFSARFGIRFNINDSISITPYGIIGVAWNKLSMDKMTLQSQNAILHQQLNNVKEQLEETKQQNIKLQQQLKGSTDVLDLAYDITAKQVHGFKLMTVDNYIEYLKNLYEIYVNKREQSAEDIPHENFLAIGNEYDFYINKTEDGLLPSNGNEVLNGNIKYYSEIEFKDEEKLGYMLIDSVHPYNDDLDKDKSINGSGISFEGLKRLLEEQNYKYIILRPSLGDDMFNNIEMKSLIKTNASDDFLVAGEIVSDNMKIYAIKTPTEDGKYTIKYVLEEDLKKEYPDINKTESEVFTKTTKETVQNEDSTKEVFLQHQNTWNIKYGCGVEIGIKKNMFITMEYRYQRPNAITVIPSSVGAVGEQIKYRHKINIHEINFGFGYYFMNF